MKQSLTRFLAYCSVTGVIKTRFFSMSCCLLSFETNIFHAENNCTKLSNEQFLNRQGTTENKLLFQTKLNVGEGVMITILLLRCNMGILFELKAFLQLQQFGYLKRDSHLHHPQLPHFSFQEEYLCWHSSGIHQCYMKLCYYYHCQHSLYCNENCEDVVKRNWFKIFGNTNALNDKKINLKTSE